MYRLVFMLDGEMTTFAMEGDRVTLGRMVDNDVVLPDHTVSRSHAECVSVGGRWTVRDLGSRNGTRVNDEVVQERELSPGDVINLGNFSVRFEEDPRAVVQLSGGEEGVPVLEGTIIRPVEAIEQELGGGVLGGQGEAAAADADKVAKFGRIISVLAEVSRAVLAIPDLEGLLHRILDVIFEHVPVQRGVILLFNEKTKELEPRAVRQAGKDAGTFRISNSIAKKAFEDGVAILSHDAQVDPRFNAGESIRFLGIRSALCVPLKVEKAVLGLIYVDTPLKVRAFDSFDLDLLSALCGYAAVGIRQAELRAAVEAERRAKARLERYHSPSVVRRIMASGEPGEGSSLQVREVVGTILFADLVGFTAMTEHMPPGEVARMLNRFFSRMTDAIFNHEGTLDKFIGDAVMAIFGAPIPAQDHAERAVRCALEMRRSLDDLNRDTLAANPLTFRIGINTGPLVAGDIGSVRRMEYTVLGTTVNVASRLESEVAKPGQIVVGEATYNVLKYAFAFENVGKVKVKGLSQPLAVYEVLGDLGADDVMRL